MAHSGRIRFIGETTLKAIVEETEAGADSPRATTVLNADFSAKAREDVISYTYNVAGVNNDGRDVTII